MNISQVYAVYFSATEIHQQKGDHLFANALLPSALTFRWGARFHARRARGSYEFADGDLVVFGMPTYAGKTSE